MNYSDLVDAIKDYAENSGTDFTAAIPTFVKQAEQRIYRSVNLPVNRKSQAGTISDGDIYLSTPSDFLVPLSLSITSSSKYFYVIKMLTLSDLLTQMLLSRVNLNTMLFLIVPSLSLDLLQVVRM